MSASPVFTSQPPAWTTNSVPGFRGHIWAPDIVCLDGTYHLYYSVSTWGSQVSAMGLATSTDLATGHWIDRGKVIESRSGDPYNRIDPSVLVEPDGRFWLAFGSYWNGIYLVQLDRATGQRIALDSPVTHLACNSAIEAACLWRQGEFHYLFVNWGKCCRGIESTYNIRVGRAKSVTGPISTAKVWTCGKVAARCSSRAMGASSGRATPAS